MVVLPTFYNLQRHMADKMLEATLLESYISIGSFKELLLCLALRSVLDRLRHTVSALYISLRIHTVKALKMAPFAKIPDFKTIRSINTSLSTPASSSDAGDMIGGSTAQQDIDFDPARCSLPIPPQQASSPHTQEHYEDEDTFKLLMWTRHLQKAKDNRANLLVEAKCIRQQIKLASLLANTAFCRRDPTTGTREILLNNRNKMKIIKNLGSGASGVVESVQFAGMQLARKELHEASMTKAQKRDLVRQEANIMEKCQHRHTPTLVGTYARKEDGYEEKFSILTSPVAVCSLQDYLSCYAEVCEGRENITEAHKLHVATLGQGYRKYRPKPYDDAKWCQYLKTTIHRRLDEILGCLATVVEHIHLQKVRHLDLKPDNIVLSPGELFITDFGISWDLKERTQSKTGRARGRTLGFCAPEVEKEDDYSPAAADVYSLGCIFLHIATLRYGGNITHCKEALSTPLEQRMAAIKKFLAELKALPLVRDMYEVASGFGTHRPYFALIEEMLAFSIEERPPISAVNKTLRENGAFEQIYHGICCKRRHANYKRFQCSKEQNSNPTSDVINGQLAPALFLRGNCTFDAALAQAAVAQRKDLWSRKLGPLVSNFHPEVLADIDTLVQSLMEVEDFEQAKRMSLLAMGRWTIAFGPNHPGAISSMKTLALIFQVLGQRDSAERLLRRAYKFSLETYGPNHHLTLKSMDELASILSSGTTYKEINEARQLLLEAFKKKSTALGETYDGTLCTMHQLALLLCRLKRFSEAEKLLRTETAALEAQDSSHPSLLGCYIALANIYEQQKKSQTAREAHARTAQLKVILKRRFWGTNSEDHWYILSLPRQVSFISDSTLALEEEEKARYGVLKMRMGAEGRQDLIPDILNDMHGIWCMLILQGRSTEAADLQHQVLLKLGFKGDETQSSLMSEEQLSDSGQEERLDRTFSYDDASRWTDITTNVVSVLSSPVREKQLGDEEPLSSPQSMHLAGNGWRQTNHQGNISGRPSAQLCEESDQEETPRPTQIPRNQSAADAIDCAIGAPSTQFAQRTRARMSTHNKLATLLDYARHEAHEPRSFINDWLLRNLAESHMEVRLLAIILEARGVALSDDTAVDVLTAWCCEGGRGRLRAPGRAFEDLSTAGDFIRQSGYDQALIQQLIGDGTENGQDEVETEHRDEGAGIYDDNLSMEGTCGDETIPEDGKDEEME